MLKFCERIVEYCLVLDVTVLENIIKRWFYICVILRNLLAYLR
jgi:hypothetical protein